MKARQRPGRAGGGGDGEPSRQAETFQPGRKVGDEPFLAAEQVRCALDVEEKSVGAVFRTPRRSRRRIARRPQRQMPQRGGIGGSIGCAHLQMACLGARICQRLAEYEALGFGRFVQGGKARPAGRGKDKDERTFGINRRAAGDFRLRGEKTQDRPARQPD